MTTSTNGMPITNNRGAGVDVDDMIPNLAWKPKVVAKTADYTVSQAESGTYFTTEGATAAVAFTLPAASTGPWAFKFFAAEDVSLTVTAETADTMVVFNNLAADGAAFSTSSEIIGGAFEVFSAGGSVVYCIAMGAGGHVQTLTVVDA